MQTKKKRIITISCILSSLLLLVGAAFLLYKINTYTLELENNGTITLEYGIDTAIPEQKAVCHGTIFYRKGVDVPITVIGKWDCNLLGEYDVSFETDFGWKRVARKGKVIVQDTLAPEITLVSDPNHFTSPVATYQEEGYSAFDLYDGDVTATVVREEKDGIVYYAATDSHGNSSTKEREIVYKDVIPPIITLTGDTDYKAQIGQAYSDPGFVATDECDGDISQNVTVEGSIDIHTAGTYSLTYKVADSSGNIAETHRNVIVTDLQGPVIKLSGEKEFYLKMGTAYSEAGYTASDNLDGDITSKVQVSGTVDVNKSGYYTITYSVSDSYGHTTSQKRTVFVYEKQAVSASENPGDKVIYLTFDDGPSKHTARLLNILDKYGVKATFFVTNQFSSYQYMIGETHKRGHTIALHTYSHKYSQVYASESAYFEDLNKIKAVVETQTGVSPTIVRFPGGTNNTVSRHYCNGIMSKLSKTLSYHGYLYCDWNVSSGDAGGAKTSDAVANNVINGVKRQNVSIVLQHDITSFSVEAVDKIIFWGIQNGYTFLPMSETTPMVHYKPQN